VDFEEHNGCDDTRQSVVEFCSETRRYRFTMDDALLENDGKKVYLNFCISYIPFTGVEIFKLLTVPH
jgi:hypothetical protein